MDDFGISPVIRSTDSPPLNTKRQGIPLIEYFFAVSKDFSTLTFTNFTLPAYSSAISSTIGPSYLQGPHQVAQKSTTTGVSAFKTSPSKLLSSASNTLDISKLLIYLLISSS